MKNTIPVDAINSGSFDVAGYHIVSQDHTVVTDIDKDTSRLSYLPIFLSVWHAIERVTGYRWKCTSYLRDSPSHRMGQAFDLAPDIADDSLSSYAVTNNSDPVLHQRTRLLQRLKKLTRARLAGSPKFRLGIFVESDHLHLQVLAPEFGKMGTIVVVTWPVPKPIYPDTLARMRLGPIKDRKDIPLILRN